VRPELLLAFTAASVGLFFIPGPAMSVILANSAAHGTRAGVLTVIGNVLGFAVMLAIVLAGLEWLVSSFADWFPYVRLAGAAYLIVLGLQSLSAARRHWGQPAAVEAEPAGIGFFRSGAIVAFANPAVIAFLAAYLPQFIDPAAPTWPQFLVLGAIFLAVAFFVGSGLALVADRASRWLLGGNRALIDALAGVILVAGGLVLAFARG